MIETKNKRTEQTLTVSVFLKSHKAVRLSGGMGRTGVRRGVTGRESGALATACGCPAPAMFAWDARVETMCLLDSVLCHIVPRGRVSPH